MENELPVVVVGAGPIGLATAAHLSERGVPVLVLERGAGPATAVSEWGHVRMFSPWSELVDAAAARLLAPTGWTHPVPDAYPTGAEWVSWYLRPLAAALGDRVRYGAEVVGVARRGRDRVVDAGRLVEPFTVHLATPAGHELVEARAVVDASGTWGGPGPLGGDGLPAVGERDSADRIAYRLPDLADDAVRARYAGRRVVVAGSGHSALTALVALAGLVAEHPTTEITWLLRRGGVGQAFGGGDADELPARGALGQRARAAVDAGAIHVVTGFRTAAVHRDGHELVLESVDGRKLDPADEVIALTGFRPDLTWLSELRLDLDAILQAPRTLAPLIDPNVHSCGTVEPHGARELAQPEPDVYLVGMKSYGRAPSFLALTGYEQVRSVAAGLAGDHESAMRVELVLPETGVCGGSGVVDTTCCS